MVIGHLIEKIFTRVQIIGKYVKNVKMGKFENFGAMVI